MRYLQCRKCGGTQGTLVKMDEEYQHQREVDCNRHRAIEEAKAKIMSQARPIKKEVT
jgi:hypothetical protein